MPLITQSRRLAAAAASMHQFCPLVRNVFRGDVPDSTVESATMFLYVSVAREVWGPRFAKRLAAALESRLRCSSLDDIRGGVMRLSRVAGERGRSMVRQCSGDEFLAGIYGVLAAFEEERARVLMNHCDDPNEIERADADFPNMMPSFNEAIRGIKRHLTGIRKQHFLMFARAA